ncbi:MAG: cation:proton antiporter [Candidatus Saccharimonadales bacterium]|jgi:Kef-type K+ transport system membrane component KefB
MESSIFLQLSAVLAVAAVVSIVMRLLRQPLIVGYILTGVLVGPTALDLIHNHEAFDSFSEIGIMLLLFIVGLGLNVGVIRATGKPVALVFLLNALVMVLFGFCAAELMHLTTAEAIVAGLGLFFSSTIVIVKSLVDKRAQHRLYGQIAIGVILLDDVMATLALLFVATAKTGGTSLSEVGVLLAKGGGLALLLIAVGGYLMPHVTKFFARSQEMLFGFALAWAFGIASLFHLAGFSAEVGALLAGVSLASLAYASEISTRLKPLRDFFLLLFFVTLGEKLNLGNIQNALLPALVFSAIAITVKPLSTQVGMGLLRYTKQTGFKTAIHLSNISEFSVILGVLAHKNGLVSARLIDILTLTALITIAVSTYLMHYDDKLYRLFANLLNIFERKDIRPDASHPPQYKLFLFGYHKGGHEFINTFRDMKKKYVVVDYDPEVIETLERQHIKHVYGDATDYELLEELGVGKAEMVVSILPGHTTNRELLKYYLKHNPEGIFICHSTSYDNAAELYEHGASYVILPRLIGTEKMSAFIRQHGNDKAAFENYRKRHIITLGQAAIR